MHVAQGERFVAARAAPEQRQDLMREEPEAGRLHRADDEHVTEHQEKGLLDAVVVSRAVVEAHDGLSSDRTADRRGIEQEVDLCDDAGGGKRFAPAIRGERAVAAQGTVEDCVHEQHSGLIEAAGCADRGDLRYFGTGDCEVPPQQFSCPEAAHIEKDHHGGNDLSHDSGDRSACDPHVEGEQEQVVQDKIQRDPGHRRGQREPRAPVGADQQCAAGRKRKKRKARRDQAHIRERIGKDLLRRTEQVHEPGRE